ncbi:DUF4286 family protein [Mycobacterium noviomagense]|uniref:EthD domain-containing protein n=1 Tax=Mycobacterium noviomagense TaxID=459858 RepID=A0A7I7PAX8_9MYCO|nr:DUF4286 family protein [Mycobacterium noviomagense]ORB11071.1 hypothetical protein BST37_21025 [Mycobacterium noviomagense]BBY05718.1 hypothetical protein MNVI_10360 [Mycobacterium noviomagense]
MPKGVLHVESRPSSPDRDAEYNSWYDDIHLPQLLSLDGFVAARRLRPVADDGPYVALYEIEGDDLQAILDNMLAHAGDLQLSDALQLDPPPTMRLLELTTERRSR